ncbi:MAG: hypothetical protein A2Z30_07590 [Chloroflexi bacterium RBG_16_64_43]|nr:MAG: hypothetical protein A2Z30_07590 [Chloroflexi bacterium RBG_16_64_43]
MPNRFTEDRTVESTRHHEPAPRVYLGPIGPDYDRAVAAGLEWIGLEKRVKSSSVVFLKPNLTYPEYRPGVMTHPAAIEAVVRALGDYTSHIFIGDGDSGGYNPFPIDEVFRATGLLEFERRYGARVVNLSRLPSVEVEMHAGRGIAAVPLPRLLCEEIDLLISVPVPKIHCNTGVSLSLKNLWGCVSSTTRRLRLHPWLADLLIGIQRTVHAEVAIVDGLFGLNRNGPMRGDPVELGWLLVADPLGAAERIACELMQVDLRSIPHLRRAQVAGLIPALGAVELQGDLNAHRRERFYLRRELTDLPGYLAFHSPGLTYLAYFSPLSGILHRMLDRVRTPFYDYEHYRELRRGHRE